MVMKQMRGKRFSMKTTIIALVVIGVLWSIAIYAHARTAVPPEFQILPSDTATDVHRPR